MAAAAACCEARKSRPMAARKVITTRTATSGRTGGKVRCVFLVVREVIMWLCSGRERNVRYDSNYADLSHCVDGACLLAVFVVAT